MFFLFVLSCAVTTAQPRVEDGIAVSFRPMAGQTFRLATLEPGRELAVESHDEEYSFRLRPGTAAAWIVESDASVEVIVRVQRDGRRQADHRKRGRRIVVSLLRDEPLVTVIVP